MDKGVIEMAKSPAHRFGQIIGNLLEETLIRYCQPIAEENDMYLDYKHSRIARNNQSEVRWTDINGNTHKLDIVMESEGSEECIGKPRAFIEMAWRRYTKHSKNKAQEISAAIKPLVGRYSEFNPFYGVVLAGEFTENSLNQMKSEGFKILYFSMRAIEEAFASQNIYIHWEEDTSEQELQDKVDQFERLSDKQQQLIGDYLMSHNKEQWEIFLQCLQNALKRTIESIYIISLFGEEKEFCNIQDACDYIDSDQSEIVVKKNMFRGYEIMVKYSNGDKIEMRFQKKKDALTSLNKLV